MLDTMGKYINLFIRFFMLIVFSIYFILNLFIKARYNIVEDSPYFQPTNVFYAICLILFVFCLILIVYNMDKVNDKLNIKIITSVYFLLAALYIILLPLKPFSDMNYIYEGALKFSSFNIQYFKGSDYFNSNNNNLMIAIIYGVLFIILPKTILTIKISNIIFIILTALISRKIYLLFCAKYDRLLYVFILSLVSIFFYNNFIYSDILFNLLSLFSIYLYLKNSNNIFSSVLILSLGISLRATALIYIIAVLIDYLCKKQNMKKKLKTLFFVVLVIITSVIGLKLFNSIFIDNNRKTLPIASYLYIGMNKEKYGFQDQTHSLDRTYIEVMNRIENYSAKDLLEIFIKKSYWTWMEGTYQASRYAFGNNVTTGIEKFEYNTPLTDYFLADSQKAILIANIIMNIQYSIFFFLMLLNLYKQMSDKQKVINLIIFGHFLFYLMWEIKSRYIISLYPYMIIMAMYTIVRIYNYKLKREV